MLSTNSLSAFSSATTTSATTGTSGIRLVREPASAAQSGRPATKNVVPDTLPSVAPPRGSLLNLSV